MRISLEAAKQRYGQIAGGVWPDEPIWCFFASIPAGIKLINSATVQVMTRIYCNRDMIAPLERALAAVVAAGVAGELETFDGCLMVRDVRGEPGKPSTHCYALAIDFNAKKFPLGSALRFSPAFVKCFTDQGFDYGGDFSRKDPMHLSLAWEGKDHSVNPQ